MTEETARSLRHRKLLLGVLVILALTLRAIHLENHLASPLGKLEDVATNTDLSTFAIWAREIAAGDWLGRDPHHTNFEWMKEVAPPKRFMAWWGGKEVFHQNPLYAYLLAISYAVFDSSLPLLVLQVLMSAIGVVLVYDLGRRFFDARAGFVAAGLSAVFAPSIFLDSLVLRASFNASLTLLSVWLLLGLADRVSAWRGFATGVCLGASFMLRPTGLALLVAGPAVLFCFAEPRRAWRRWLPWFVAGMVLTIGPFVARNLLVGAPAMRFSTRGPETVIQANSRSADPGLLSIPEKRAFGRMMDAGHTSLGAALSTAIASWPEDNPLGWWLWHEWQKLICVLRDFEYMDNANFYYYRRETPGLSLLPTFGWLVGLGCVGIVLIGALGRDRRRSWIPLLALAALLAGCLIGFALGRYRLPLAVLLTVPAGATVSAMVAWIGKHEFFLAGLVLLVATSISVLSFSVVPKRAFFPVGQPPWLMEGCVRGEFEAIVVHREQEYCDAARALYARGESQAASDSLAAYVDDHVAFSNAAIARLTGGLRGPMATRALDVHLSLIAIQLETVRKVFMEIGDQKRADDVAKLVAHAKRQLQRLRRGR